MLARAVMPVVFVLAEKIRRGIGISGDGGKTGYGFNYALVFLKSATVTKH